MQDEVFYATSFSASGGRVVVRDWIETTVGSIRTSLARWFIRQRLVNAFGQPPEPLGVYRLAASLYRDARRDMSPNVPRALLNCALQGTALPYWILYKAIIRDRAEQGVNYARMVLCKMGLSAMQGLNEEEEDAMASLDLENRQPAYLCGRLLAELERIQWLAVRPKATIVDRYFGSASTAPGSVFGSLLRGAQAHLGKLRKERPGTHAAVQQQLEEIMAKLPPRFPAMLSLTDQALFSLGYYHQRAADRAAAVAHKAGAVKDKDSSST
jgi:CRISPR-associated protein Csd1